MIKIICDGCGKEQKQTDCLAKNVDFPGHLQGVQNGADPDRHLAVRAYVDENNDIVASGTFTLNFCPRCYNRIHEAALKEVWKITQERNAVPL